MTEEKTTNFEEIFYEFIKNMEQPDEEVYQITNSEMIWELI